MSDTEPTVPAEPEPEPVETPEETMARLAEEDTRARTAVTKAINLAQLDAELGGHGLAATGDPRDHADVVTETIIVAQPPVTQAALEAALAQHAADPDFGLSDEDRRARELKAKAEAGTLTDPERNEALDILLARSL